MVERRSVIAGLIAGSTIVFIGTVLIAFQDAPWALFEFVYSTLGIQAQQTQLWSTFMTAIGVLTTLFGLCVIWTVVMRARNSGIKSG